MPEEHRKERAEDQALAAEQRIEDLDLAAEQRGEDLATAEVIQAGAAKAALAAAGEAAKLTEVAQQLVATAQESIYQSTKSRLLRGLVVFFILASLVGEATALTMAAQNRSTLTTATEGTERVKDCTTPEGSCYQRGQAQTATAIATLQRFTLIAVECAHEGTDAQIEACVLAKSRAQGLVK